MEELFAKVIEYGRLVRANGLDGLKAWNDIKGLFESQIACRQWNIVRTINGQDVSDIQSIYDYVHGDLGMDGDDSDDKSDHNLWSKKHFFLQLIRIIKNNPDYSFVRLAQIAYNIGQLSNHIDSDPLYEGDALSYYYGNKLNEIGSYIDVSKCDVKSAELEELIQKLDEKIEAMRKQTGGNQSKYYSKYLKYKEKYLQLKKQSKIN